MKAKEFDAVQFMRRVRAKMNEDMKEMSFEEQKAYIEHRASKACEEYRLRKAHATKGPEDLHVSDRQPGTR